MRTIYLIFIIVIILSGVVFFENFQKNIDEKRLGISSKATSPPIVMPSNTVEIKYNNTTYWLSYIRVPDNAKLFLYTNFRDKESSRNLIKKNSCQGLINGGFYTGANQPLGLLISEGVKIKNKTSHTLIPVIFYITQDGQTDISYNLPESEIRLALQTGPLLIENGIPKKLAIRNDSRARRSIVAVSQDNKIMFITAYESLRPLSGPYLTDLPQVFDQFQKLIDFKVIKAANLDGGFASAFYNGTFFLEEVSYIGSYFCLVI